MEMILRWLGRPDLAKYVRENRRSSIDYYYDTENLADTLEFPGHRVSKRHTSEKDKKKKKNKKNNKRKQKNSKTQNKKVGKNFFKPAMFLFSSFFFFFESYDCVNDFYTQQVYVQN